MKSNAPPKESDPVAFYSYWAAKYHDLARQHETKGETAWMRTALTRAHYCEKKLKALGAQDAPKE